ncbi:MAG: alpha/beta hydrolase [Lachnospiraceae bacterium]|nr:alpha/beta hydrolase [Lachnospiraceae bacterium]
MRKKILYIVCIAIILLLAVDLFVGNYLVTFAIARKESVNYDIVPKASIKTDAQRQMEENAKLVLEKADKWLEQAEMEQVSLTSEDGLTLQADYFENKDATHNYAIVVHGYTGNRTNMRQLAAYYAEKGYHILTPDLRAHGQSEGDYIGMGWLDRKDILKWIDYLLERDPDAVIVLHGVSMGGATVMMTSGEDLPENVKAIVDDCGYTSVWDIFSDEIKYLFHIPTFPVLNTASAFGVLRAGYSFREASAIEQVKRTRVPIFFTHGSEDTFVHTDMVYELYDACPTEKELYVAQGAGHGQAIYLDPQLYFDKIFAFLDRYMGE